jgi:hypothetical protein
MTEQRPSDRTGSGVWKQHAQQWQRIGTPLHLSAEDGSLMLELVQLPWPADARMLAINQSALGNTSRTDRGNPCV